MASLRAIASADTMVLPQPLAMRFRSAGDLALVGDGLDISVTDTRLPLQPRALRTTPSGWWTTQRLPGFQGWPSDRDRTLGVTLSDRFGRFLPAKFELAIGKAPPAEQPRTPGEISPWSAWPSFNASRTRPLRPATAPADYVPDYLPLFPAPAWTAPSVLAQVRAHLAVPQPDGSLRDAAWAAMTVEISNRIVGLGLADGGGAIVTAFPYPTYPVQAPQSGARPAITWQATIRIYWKDLAGDPPPMEALLGQLTGTAKPTLAQLPATTLPAQTLTLGQPLVLRTRKSASETLSSLYLKTP